MPFPPPKTVHPEYVPASAFGKQVRVVDSSPKQPAFHSGTEAILPHSELLNKSGRNNGVDDRQRSHVGKIPPNIYKRTHTKKSRPFRDGFCTFQLLASTFTWYRYRSSRFQTPAHPDSRRCLRQLVQTAGRCIPDPFGPGL